MSLLLYGFCVCVSGRKDPVPFEMKDDHMGLGRWTMEVCDKGV